MNEKIKELAEQAGLEMCRCGCNMPTRQTAKFANLIIQECIDVIKDSDAECRDEWDYAERDLVGLIHKYFGV